MAGIHPSTSQQDCARPHFSAALAGLFICLTLVFAGCDREQPPVAAPSTVSAGNLSPRIADDVARIEAQEEHLNQTAWAKEMLAQECGRTFETLWDQINAATNKLATAARFTADEVVLGTWDSPVNLAHGIIIKTSSGAGPTLQPGQWRQQLACLAQAGWQLEQIEFRQVRFETDAAGHPRESQFFFSAHLSNSIPAERAILEGDLTITWGPPAADGPASVHRIDASRLALKTRLGAPPFQLVLQETIAAGSQPFATEPLMVYDLDGDGLSEIILPIKNLVYRRQSDGRYQSTKLCRHPAGIIGSALLADFDSDGRADLLCATREGLVLFNGTGELIFDRPGQLVWKAEPPLASPMVLTCGDIDGDGDLDVFLGQYKLPYRDGQIPTPYYDANDGDPAYLLLNDGHGHFTDVTAAAGLGPKRHRRSLSGSLVDLNADGHLDLAVVSDFAGLDVYQGDGQGHFTEVTRQWFPESHGFGMGHALADFNADGRLDLLMTGMPSPTVDRLEKMGLWRPDSTEDRSMRAKMTFGNRLHLAAGNGRFESSPASGSIARSGWSWGCSALDFDNDGFPDIYIGNGMESRASVRDYEAEFWLHDAHVANSKEDPAVDIYLRGKATRLRGHGVSYGGYEKNRFYINLKGASYVEVAYLLGVALELDSRSVVADDLDGDGRMDLLVTSFEPWPQTKRTVRAYRNTLAGGGHWIGFRFPETPGGISPVGVQVTLRAGGRSVVSQLVTGDSHHSQSANTRHFGLGSIDRVESVEIRSPSGRIVTLQRPAIDQYHTARLGRETQP